MDNLAGKTAVITGAASGIGLAMAHRFGAAEMNLVLADIERDALEAASRTLAHAGYPTARLEVDVRDVDQLRELERVAVDRFDKVHVLCNNAGVGGGGPVADPDDIELWRWTIDVNLWGVIQGCKVFLPGMLAHGESGHVVNTASMAGHVSAPGMGAYNVSKYGVVALSETLSKEMQLAASEIGVSVLCPAFVATGIAESHRNAPAELSEHVQARSDQNPEMVEFVRALIDGGMPAPDVAAAVFDAVLSNEFWILTHAESSPAITARAADIVAGRNPAPGFDIG